MKSLRNGRFFLALAVLTLSSLACNFFTRGATNTTPIPVTTQAVEELEQNVQEAATAAAAAQPVTLVIDEAQLTSLVAFELQDQTEPRITDPQVLLRNGQVTFQADVEQSGLTLPLEVVLTVAANAQGRPEYDVVSANLGPLPLPDSMLNQLESQLDRILADNLPGNEVFIEDITIADGKMTITGYKQ